MVDHNNTEQKLFKEIKKFLLYGIKLLMLVSLEAHGVMLN